MFEFKFTILTPWTLLSSDLPEELCKDEPAIEFAHVLCNRTLLELDRHSFWPRARGEAFIRKSFDSFEERFLRQSEYAVIVLSGRHITCLDNIYPRFLVFLTIRPSWADRLLLVFLGEPEGDSRFDTKILTHAPIVFRGSMNDAWASDEESWTKLLGVLQKSYFSQSSENLLLNTKRGSDLTKARTKWISVTDVRGRPLAVRIQEQSTQVNFGPASWHDLTFRDGDIWTNQSSPYSTNCICSPLSQSVGRLSRPNERCRSGSCSFSEGATHFALSHDRSNSVPSGPHRCPERYSPHGCSSNPSQQTSSNISPYLRHSFNSKIYCRDSENQSVIEEQEEEITFGAGIEEQASVLQKSVTNSQQNSEHMCLPRVTLAFRTHQGNTNAAGTDEKLHALDENKTATAQKTLFGKIRNKRNKHLLEEKLPHPDESNYERGERKQIAQRFKGCGHGFRKLHRKGETFGARSRKALGGTLKSLANFSTGILATDPESDVKSTHMVEARSCPNIREARSRQLSPDLLLSTLKDDSESKNKILHLTSHASSICAYSKSVHALVDNYSTNISKEHIGPVITVQRPVEQHLPVSKSAQTDFSMSHIPHGNNLFNLSAVRHDSGRGSMSPIPTDLSTEVGSRTWMCSTDPNSPNTDRADSRAKSESEFVPSSDEWDRSSCLKSLVSVSSPISPPIANDQAIIYPNENTGSESELCTSKQLSLTHEAYDVQEQLHLSYMVDHTKTPQVSRIKTTFDESTPQKLTFLDNEDTFVERNTTPPVTTTEDVRVQHSNPNYVYLQDSLDIRVKDTKSSKTDKIYVKPMLNSEVYANTTSFVIKQQDIDKQNAKTLQLQNVPNEDFELESSLTSNLNLPSCDFDSPSSLYFDVQQAPCIKLKPNATSNLTDSIEPKSTLGYQFVLETDVDADKQEAICLTGHSGVHSSLENSQTTETGVTSLLQVENVLDNVLDIHNVNNVPSSMNSDVFLDLNETDRKCISYKIDDTLLDKNMLSHDMSQVQKSSDQMFGYQTNCKSSQVITGVDTTIPKTVQLECTNLDTLTANPGICYNNCYHTLIEEKVCPVRTASISVIGEPMEEVMTKIPSEDTRVILNQTQSCVSMEKPISRFKTFTAQLKSEQVIPSTELPIFETQLVPSETSEMQNTHQVNSLSAKNIYFQPNSTAVAESNTILTKSESQLQHSDSVSPEMPVITICSNSKEQELNTIAAHSNHLKTDEVICDNLYKHEDFLNEYTTDSIETSVKNSAQSFIDSSDTQLVDEDASETWYGWLSRKMFGRRDYCPSTERNDEGQTEKLLLEISEPRQKSLVPELIRCANVDHTLEKCTPPNLGNNQTVNNEAVFTDSVKTKTTSNVGTPIRILGGDFPLSPLEVRTTNLALHNRQIYTVDNQNEFTELNDAHLSSIVNDTLRVLSQNEGSQEIMDLVDVNSEVIENISNIDTENKNQRIQSTVKQSENVTHESILSKSNNWADDQISHVATHSKFSQYLDMKTDLEPVTFNVVSKLSEGQSFDEKYSSHAESRSQTIEPENIAKYEANATNGKYLETLSVQVNNSQNTTMNMHLHQCDSININASNEVANLPIKIASLTLTQGRGTEEKSFDTVQSQNGKLFFEPTLNDQYITRFANKESPFNHEKCPEVTKQLRTIKNLQTKSDDSMIDSISEQKISRGHERRTSKSEGNAKPPITDSNPEGEHIRFESQTDEMKLVPMGVREVTRPSQWSFIVVTSIFDFVTIYIPRNAYWFYSATFVSRDQLFEAMAEHGIHLAISWERIETGLRNPYCVGIMFLCITSMAPYIGLWPQLARSLLNVTDWFAFTPPFWVDRPILYYLGEIVYSVHRRVNWHGQTVITSFNRFPWALVNPSEQ